MKLTIYQINHERDKNNVCFISYDNLPKYQKTQEVDSSIYDKAYTGNVDCKRPEDVFRLFNEDLPKEYIGRSLSVSDVIEIRESENIAEGFYFCDRFGFRRISFDPEKVKMSERFAKDNGAGKLSVLLVEPDKEPRMVEIDDTLEAMQELVGGYIEEYILPEHAKDEAIIICNEEGKLQGLPLNRAIYSKSGRMVEAIAGSFFVALAPFESEKIMSLPRSLAQKYKGIFMHPDRFFLTSQGLTAVPYTPTRGDRER